MHTYLYKNTFFLVSDVVGLLTEEEPNKSSPPSLSLSVELNSPPPPLFPVDLETGAAGECADWRDGFFSSLESSALASSSSD